MATYDEFSLKIFGLERDNGNVRAEVFAQKMSLLVKALRAADKFANGKKSFDHLIEELQKSSALVSVRERRAFQKRVGISSVATLGEVFAETYNGNIHKSVYSNNLFNFVRQIADGAEEKFSHAEIKYPGENVIRIDKFFVKQAAEVQDLGGAVAEDEDDELFSGISAISYDGVLEVLDKRGSLIRGKLTLSAGSQEIDCVLPQALLVSALSYFGRRVRVDGFAIFDGTDYLPQRLNVEKIHEVNPEADLLVWRGKFKSLRRARASDSAWGDAL